ncbi:hypothetical protein [Xanthomonas axonopodis]|nr:hypothetical protein [Xanthomonas axonopodis]
MHLSPTSNDEHRIVYKANDGIVLIAQLRCHDGWRRQLRSARFVHCNAMHSTWLIASAAYHLMRWPIEKALQDGGRQQKTGA